MLKPDLTSEQLEAFDVPVCRKCTTPVKLNGWIKVEYVDMSPKPGFIDYLECTCMRCGFKWQHECADYRKGEWK